jgi:hypothetical protein
MSIEDISLTISGDLEIVLVDRAECEELFMIMSPSHLARTHGIVYSSDTQIEVHSNRSNGREARLDEFYESLMFFFHVCT